MAEDETGRSRSFHQTHGSNSLEKRLDRLQQAEAKRTARAQPDPSDQLWQQLFGHLIGAPVGGGVIGWGLDSCRCSATGPFRCSSC